MDWEDKKALDAWFEEGGQGAAFDERRAIVTAPKQISADPAGMPAVGDAPEQWSFDGTLGMLTIFGLSALRLGKRWGIGLYLSDGVTSCVCEYPALGTAARFDVLGRAAVMEMPCADISAIMPGRLALELWLDKRLTIGDLRGSRQTRGKIVLPSLRVGGMLRPAIIVDERTHRGQHDFSFIADPKVVAAALG